MARMEQKPNLPIPLAGGPRQKGGRKRRNDEIKESTGKSAEMILGPALVKLESEMEISSPPTLPAMKKRKRDPNDKVSQSFDIPESQSKMRNSISPSGDNMDFTEDLELRRADSASTSFAFTPSLPYGSSREDSVWDQRSNICSINTQLLSLRDSSIPSSPSHSSIPYDLGALPQEEAGSLPSPNARPETTGYVTGFESFDGETSRAPDQDRGSPTDKPIIDLTSDAYPDPANVIHENGFSLWRPLYTHSDVSYDVATERTKDLCGFSVSEAPAAAHDSLADYERDKGQEADLPEGGMLGDSELRTDLDALSIERMEGMAREGSSEEPYMPAEIDDDEDVWEVEALLAKWTRGRQTFYLVKWKGYPDEDNSWVGRRDISDGLVDEFDDMYSKLGGSHLGVELLRKRIRRGIAEFFVRWKGRPESENGWQRESTISRERIREYEAGGKGSC